MWLWRVEACRCNHLQAKANEMKTISCRSKHSMLVQMLVNAITPASFRHMLHYRRSAIAASSDALQDR